MANTLTDFFHPSIFTPDGMEYHLNDLAEYVSEGSDGFGMAPFKRFTQRGVLQNGVTDVGFRLEPRVLKFKLKVRASTPNQHYELRQELLNIFQPRNEPLTLRLTLPDGGLRELRCYLQSGLGYPSADRKGLVQDADIVLYAPDPTFYNYYTHSHTFSFDIIDHLTFPITFPIVFGSGTISNSEVITYAGNWYSYPQFIVYGPLNYFQIIHNDTGKKIKYEHDVITGEKITITLEYGNKSVVNNFYENLIGYLSDDTDLGDFCISHELAGKINSIYIVGAGALAGETRVEMNWYDRYLGI